MLYHYLIFTLTKLTHCATRRRPESEKAQRFLDLCVLVAPSLQSIGFPRTRLAYEL